MKEYIEKTISKEIDLAAEDGEPIRLHVSRTRDTNGSVCIKLAYGRQYILFTDQTHYEEHARYAAEYLRDVADDLCAIPKGGK